MAAYAALVGLGLRALAAASTAWTEARWLAALFAAAVAVQVAIPIGAPDEYDLTKWAYVNYLPGSTGYFRIARDQAARGPVAVPRQLSGLDSRTRIRCTSARIRRA